MMFKYRDHDTIHPAIQPTLTVTGEKATVQQAEKATVQQADKATVQQAEKATVRYLN